MTVVDRRGAVPALPAAARRLHGRLHPRARLRRDGARAEPRRRLRRACSTSATWPSTRSAPMAVGWWASDSLRRRQRREGHPRRRQRLRAKPARHPPELPAAADRRDPRLRDRGGDHRLAHAAPARRLHRDRDARLRRDHRPHLRRTATRSRSSATTSSRTAASRSRRSTRSTCRSSASSTRRINLGRTTGPCSRSCSSCCS